MSNSDNIQKGINRGMKMHDVDVHVLLISNQISYHAFECSELSSKQTLYTRIPTNNKIC